VVDRAAAGCASQPCRPSCRAEQAARRRRPPRRRPHHRPPARSPRSAGQSFPTRPAWRPSRASCASRRSRCAPEEDRSHRASADLWQRIRQGFAIPDSTAPWWRSTPRTSPRAPNTCSASSTAAGVPLSHRRGDRKRGRRRSWRCCRWSRARSTPMAYSRAHASGLWQFHPGNRQALRAEAELVVDGRRDTRRLDQPRRSTT